jgi:methylmalonyl-CoA mutase N-terminal domain/subunit
MVYDGMEYVIRNCPKASSPVNNPGHNARANGINAYQEIAMVLANAIDRFDEMQRRGLTIDQVAPFLATVNFASHRDFFEEICKMRAFRRMWYQLLTQRYHATTPRALAVRMHAITCSDDLSYQQPMNNIVRNTLRALAAALAGVQGLGVAGYDEAISAPTKESLLLSIRTQQVIQLESGVANVIDPLGGSYYIEWLTNEIEKRAWEYLREIEERGGLLCIIESGWAHKEAWKGQTERENKVANDEMKVVGVNCFQMEEEPFSVPSYRPNPQVWEDAMKRLNAVRQIRDEQKVAIALDELRQVAQTDTNIMPAMIDAVKAYVTIGEVGRLWRELFGVWKVPYPV